MQLVPFRNQWAESGTKLDVKAWYRRPSVHGGFSLVGPLPLRRHNDWERKGLEYVSLATLEDFGAVAPMLRADGIDVEAALKSYDRRTGQFDVPQYLKAERVRDDAYVTEIQAKVDKFGYDAVAEMMRVTDPAFVMPASVVEVKPARKGKEVAA